MKRIPLTLNWPARVSAVLLGLLCGCAGLAVGVAHSARAAQEDFALLGVVRGPDESGVPGVTVRIVGVDARETTSSGEFRIPLPRTFIGRRVTLQVSKPGWTVADTQALSLVVLADQLANPHRIRLRRVGANAPAKSAAKKPVAKPAKPQPEVTETQRLMDVATLLKGRGLNEASLKKYEEALAAARQAKLQKQEMECLIAMSWLQRLLGDYAQARASLNTVLALAVEIHADKQFAEALISLANLEGSAGNHTLSRQYYSEVRGLYQKMNDWVGETYLLVHLAQLESVLGNNDVARQHYIEARGLSQNRRVEADVLVRLGGLEASLKNYDVARQHYQTAMELCLKEGNQFGLAQVCESFGDLERALGNKQAAREQYDKAAGLFAASGLDQTAAEMKRRRDSLDEQR